MPQSSFSPIGNRCTICYPAMTVGSFLKLRSWTGAPDRQKAVATSQPSVDGLGLGPVL